MSTEDPSIGYGGEFWLADDGGVLRELVGVFNMGLPNELAERVKVTHYKSPGRRQQYIAGFSDEVNSTVEMNYAPRSPTDVLIREAKASRESRDFRQVILDADDEPYEITGTCTVLGYERTNPNEDRKTATMTITYDGDIVEDAA